MSETNGKELATREAKVNVPIRGGDFQIENIEQGYRVAQFYGRCGMLPRGIDTAEKAMLCVMFGQSLGIPSSQAIQDLAVINGRVTAYGKMVKGLIAGSGLLESYSEETVGSGDETACVVRMKRKGVDGVFVGKFSIADAKRAKLWGKSGPWTDYWPRMLHYRAYTIAASDGFSDVLKGISVREEVEDYTVTASPAPAPRVDEQLTEAVAALPTPTMANDEPPAELIFPGDAPEADDDFVKDAAAAMEAVEQERKGKRK